MLYSILLLILLAAYIRICHSGFVVCIHILYWIILSYDNHNEWLSFNKKIVE